MDSHKHCANACDSCNHSALYRSMANRYLAGLLINTLLSGFVIGIMWFVSAPMASYLPIIAAYIYVLFISVYKIIELNGYARIAKLEESGRWTKQ